MSKRKPIEWTEAHRREAERRTYEIAANLSPCEPLAAHNLARGANECAEREAAWRGLLLVALSSLPDADVLRVSARIDREVRRVDALATGQLVREPFERFETRRAGEAPTCHREWRGEDGAVDYAEYRNKMLDKLKSERPRWRAVRVRVTRIRRAR